MGPNDFENAPYDMGAFHEGELKSNHGIVKTTHIHFMGPMRLGLGRFFLFRLRGKEVCHHCENKSFGMIWVGNKRQAFDPKTGNIICFCEGHFGEPIGSLHVFVKAYSKCLERER